MSPVSDVDYLFPTDTNDYAPLSHPFIHLRPETNPLSQALCSLEYLTRTKSRLNNSEIFGKINVLLVPIFKIFGLRLELEINTIMQEKENQRSWSYVAQVAEHLEMTQENIRNYNFT
jgi:hypothetical protein